MKEVFIIGSYYTGFEGTVYGITDLHHCYSKVVKGKIIKLLELTNSGFAIIIEEDTEVKRILRLG